MKKTIIYVFGPRRLANTYFANKPMNLDEGGWLKIGQTTNSDEKLDIKECALNRIHQEARTGIPEVCQLFDVFEYPEPVGITDSEIRDVLTGKVYSLETSKKHDADSSKYEIRPGKEFVYGVKRDQVINAIAKAEHALILKHYNGEYFEELMQCINNNAKSAEQYEIEIDTTNSDSEENFPWTDMLWNSVKKHLSNEISGSIYIPKGRPYFSIQSEAYKGILTYTAGYSIRHGLASVAIETYGDVEAKMFVESKILQAPAFHPIKSIEAKQGVKNKSKWSWTISKPMDKSDEEITRWYVDALLSFYRFFEH